MSSNKEVVGFNSLEEFQVCVQVFDLVEFEENGVRKFGYYVGNGYVILIDSSNECVTGNGDSSSSGKSEINNEDLSSMKISKNTDVGNENSTTLNNTSTYTEVGSNYEVPSSLIETDGEIYVPRPIISTVSVAVKDIIAAKTTKQIKEYKYIIIPQTKVWQRLLKGEKPNVKPDDIVEIKGKFYSHFVFCTRADYAIDLNPTSPMSVFASLPFAQFFRPTLEGDNYGILNDTEPLFANGVIEEKPLSEILADREYRVLDEKVIVDMLGSDTRTLHFLKTRTRDEIKEIARKAIERRRTDYNLGVLNCGHFVMYLKYGACICYQIQRFRQLFTPEFQRVMNAVNDHEKPRD